MKNTYMIYGNYVVINMKHNLQTIIDVDDFEIADSFPNSWYGKWDKWSKSFYAYGFRAINKKTYCMFLHRLLLKPKTGLVVDHINHCTLDNRRSNLRVVTVAQNSQNMLRKSNVSRSGYHNVHWCTWKQKYQVVICVGKRHLSFGYFDDVEQANKVAIKARKELLPFSNERAI